MRFYTFDQFKIDVQQRLVFLDGEEIHLIPKVFDVLMVLVENHGQVVTKDHLMQKVWGETIVEEGNLTEAVSKLRKALGDNARTPKYIQNIPKQGYRFIAHVHEANTSQANIPAATNTETTQPLRHPLHSGQVKSGSYRWRWIIAIALIGTGAGVAFLMWQSQAERTADPFRAMQINRLTTTSNAFETAISPDGGFVAYVTGDSGQQSLRIRQVLSATDTELIPPLETRYRGLTFSRDGFLIYYARREKNESELVLYQLPVLGGQAKKLVRGVDSAITFSPDGKQMAFVREFPTQGKSALIIANVDGSEERQLTVRKSPEFYSVDGPAWSPDGKVIAAALGSFANNFHFKIMAVQVADGSEQPIGTQLWDWAMRTAWLADSTGLITVARTKSGSQNNQIWHIAWPSGKAHRITNDLNDYRGLSLTADSKKIVTVQSEVRSNIWIVPRHDPTRAVRITTDSASQNGRSGLDWTPDGRIVYTSMASGQQNLWMLNADGSQARRLTNNFGDNDLFPCVSGDGRHIAFVSSLSGSPRIWRIDIDGNNPKVLTNGNLDLKPNCSPDGQWVVYSSEREHSRAIWKISKVGIDGGEPQQLSDRLTEFPVISPDGSLIACVYQADAGSPRKVALIPIDGGTPTKLLDIPVFPWPTVRWHPDGRALDFLDKKDDSSNVWVQPLAGGPPMKLTAFDGERIFAYAWSRDGRQLACARGTVNRDVVLIGGFR